MSARKAFTLIEVLVVISILVMLMAILLPTVERVRKQAKAAVCLAREHQWSLAFKMYTDTSGGRWFEDPIAGYTQNSAGEWRGTLREGKTSIWNWGGLAARSWYKPGFAACPAATKEAPREGALLLYDAFTAWWPKDRPGSPFSTPSGERLYGPISYTLNHWVAWPPPQDPRANYSPKDYHWGICDVRGAGRIPVFFDSANYWAGPVHYIGPPPLAAGLASQVASWPMGINRHDGGVNVLFMDWSARKVGLKELWTFKWSRMFDTAGQWTKQGGVEPEDWPQWMRRFKDY